MKHVALILIFNLLLFGCVNSTINSTSNSWQAQEETFIFEKLLLVITDSEHDFFEWNEDNYDHVILGRFNNLSGTTNRNLIGNSIQRYIPYTKLIPADRLFKAQDLVPITHFENEIKALDYDAILLVQIKELWSETVITDNLKQIIPSSACQVFILDKQDYSKLFATQMNVSANSFNSFENLFERFGKDLAANLSKRGFVKTS